MAASAAIFGGSNTGALMALYERAVAAGMDPQRAASMVASDMAPEQFLAQIEQLEQRSGLGTPSASTARAPENAQSAAMQQLLQQQAAQRAATSLTPEQQAFEGRFGNDAAWLDPEFQYTAAQAPTITSQDALRFGTTADPAAAALQRQTIDQLMARARQGPSAGEAAALGQSRQAIDLLFDRANQGATPLERDNLDLESGAARELLRLAGEGATPEERAALADQRRAMGSLFSDYERGASDVELEAQAAQREAMNELLGVWKGGGATALERARRAQARAESENWVQGQRLADMQDLAERGRSGGGAELASLAQDRQAAAQRLSMADLETDAALEQRAMEALLSGSGVAGELLSGEGGIQARRLQQLLGASDAARGISGTLGGIEDRRSGQLQAGGGMAGDVADAYGAIEGRELDALLGANAGASNLASNYGNIEARAIQALLGAQGGANSMRESADAYVQRNADRMHDAALFNANAINTASADNKRFLQDAYRDMITNRQRWDEQTRDIGARVATGLLGSDIGETQFGFGQGFDTAATDARAGNNATANKNSTLFGAYTGLTPAVVGAAQDQSSAAQSGLRDTAQTGQQIGKAFATYFSGGMGGMGGGDMGRQPYSGSGPVFNPTDDQNPYRNPRYS